MDEFDSIIGALEGSALRLDADPDSVVSAEFKERCRVALERAAQEPVRIRSLPVSRKLVALVLAACLSGLIVVPALAGPGVGGTVDMFSNGVRHVFGPAADRNAVLSDPNGPFAAADATPGSALEATPTHPDNHGADVSEIAKATPEPGENHGEQVRQVARDNHGHDDATATATSTSAATSTSTATSTATATATATSTSTPTDDHHGGGDNHGSDQTGTASSTPDTNHGADVSNVAHSTPTADENHGQDVSTEAKDNHGQDEKATHGTPTATATPDTSSSPTPTPTEEPSSTHGGGNSQGGGDSHGGGNGHGGQ